jgi:hypothetical protein
MIKTILVFLVLKNQRVLRLIPILLFRVHPKQQISRQVVKNQRIRLRLLRVLLKELEEDH